jgi:hypothetical protein
MTAPKFGKVEILVKTEGPTKGSISIIKQTFDDCGLMITGDYIIVIIDERDEIKDMDKFHNYMISTMFKAKFYRESL